MHLIKDLANAEKMISKGLYVKSKDKERYFAGYLLKVSSPYIFIKPPNHNRLLKYTWENHKFYYQPPTMVRPPKGGHLKPSEIKGKVQVVSLKPGESRVPKKITVSKVTAGKVIDTKSDKYELYKHAFYKP